MTARRTPQRAMDAIDASARRVEKLRAEQAALEPKPVAPEPIPQQPVALWPRRRLAKVVAVYVVTAPAVVVRPREWAAPGASTDESPRLRGTIIDPRHVDLEHLEHLVNVGLVRKMDVSTGRTQE